ncbi:MAG TPA: alpha/beta hydrolase [Puia sp.]|uniref:alpha/beta hydrolase n=1 Tax=Puia sp. TaxID=2045100 RepID=UPI002BE3A7FA|nr:alpha/beta hydrolase [Puia sp.]HVU98766.1 alpha/beta hydrolase [Puia sp.]
MRKRKKLWLLIPVLLIVIYFVGPHPSKPVYSSAQPAVPAEPAALESYIRSQEAGHRLKPDNEARIVWADSTRKKTPYSIVYLHGFSASQGEGDPVHRYIAAKYGCNLYLPRLAEHGIDTVDAMVNLTPDRYWASAQEALAVGRQIGDKVILMGTSTGGTLALQLAYTYPDQVAALVLCSPNIAINDPNAWLLDDPWGLQIAHLVTGSDYIIAKDDYGPQWRQYWYPKYRTEAAVALEQLVETTMKKENFAKVTQPVSLFYYYKDETHQDSTVKVSAELNMFDQLGTPAALKYKEAMPEAGTHVLTSSIRSHDIPGVEKGISHFLSDIVHLPEVSSNK